MLRGSFEAFAAGIDPAALAPEGVLGMVLFFGVGVLMTVLTQSSSAAIAITLTAATGGMVSIDVAAAAGVGANVGTTSTAVLAAIGADGELELGVARRALSPGFEPGVGGFVGHPVRR